MPSLSRPNSQARKCSPAARRPLRRSILLGPAARRAARRLTGDIQTQDCQPLNSLAARTKCLSGMPPDLTRIMNATGQSAAPSEVVIRAARDQNIKDVCRVARIISNDNFAAPLSVPIVAVAFDPGGDWWPRRSQRSWDLPGFLLRLSTLRLIFSMYFSFVRPSSLAPSADNIANPSGIIVDGRRAELR